MKDLREITSKNLHLEHLEDLILEEGEKGRQNAIRFLEGINDLLFGKKSNVVISEKWDGAPSIIAGTNPENGKFFVATKGAFNITPKLLYTKEDIDSLYPVSNYRDLNEKFTIALEEFPKLGIAGILQGDVLFTKEDLDYVQGPIEPLLTFKTNTITYAVPANSKLSEQINNARIGIVFHTSYEGKTISEMTARFAFDSSALKSTDSVFLVNATIKKEALAECLSKTHREEVRDAISLLESTSIDGLVMTWVTTQKKLFKTFANVAIREGYSFFADENKYLEELQRYIGTICQKETNVLKTEKGKEKKRAHYSEIVQTIKNKSEPIKNILRLQHQVTRLKEYVLYVLNDLKKDIQTFVDTDRGLRSTMSEGFVIAEFSTNAVKLVDRKEFSRLNFNETRTWRPKTLKEVIGEKKVVFTFARMNPPTSGHELLVNSVVDYARLMNAEPRIYVSSKQDAVKNPLTKQQKLKYLKMGIPTAKRFFVDDESVFDAYSAMKQLQAEGFTDVVMVAGEDRIETFQKMVERYMGHPEEDKAFNFGSCQVVNAGLRDPDSDGLEGVSASLMREYVTLGNFDMFHLICPSRLSRPIAQEMFEDIRTVITIQEEIIRLNDTLGKERTEMPQIRADLIPEFLDFLREHGATVTQKLESPWQIKPTQIEIDSDKVFAKAESLRNGEEPKPFIVSIDDFVLDGHHQLFAMRLEKYTNALCYVVSLLMKDLLDLATSFDKAKFKSIHA